MHARIWQLTTEKLEKEDFITESDFYELNDNFFDYVADQSDEETEDDINNWLPNLLGNLFECNGREITFLKPDGFMEKWAEKICEMAEKMTEYKKDQWASYYYLKFIVDGTHLDLQHRFYLGASGEECPDCFGAFINRLYSQCEAGTKFYVGGVVDFHF